MKIFFSRKAIEDLLWLDEYYRDFFPEGATNAHRHIIFMQELLLEHPFIGRPVPRGGGRILKIPRTPFSFFYRTENDRIEITHVADERCSDY